LLDVLYQLDASLGFVLDCRIPEWYPNLERVLVLCPTLSLDNNAFGYLMFVHLLSFVNSLMVVKKATSMAITPMP
jgi:hypothetical protein